MPSKVMKAMAKSKATVGTKSVTMKKPSGATEEQAGESMPNLKIWNMQFLDLPKTYWGTPGLHPVPKTMAPEFL